MGSIFRNELITFLKVTKGKDYSKIALEQNPVTYGIHEKAKDIIDFFEKNGWKCLKNS